MSIMLITTPVNARLVTLVMIVMKKSTNVSRLLVFAVSICVIE